MTLLVTARAINTYPSIESSPANPDRQWQVNPFTWSTQVPPWRHGSLIHSLMFVWHLEPAKRNRDWKVQQQCYIPAARDTSVDFNVSIIVIISSKHDWQFFASPINFTTLLWHLCIYNISWW